MNSSIKPNIIADLQADIHRLQGYKSVQLASSDSNLGPICNAFPSGSLPLGAVHEFFSNTSEDKAASAGFVAGLLSSVLGDNGTFLWIGSGRTLFPPALVHFGIAPDRCIFIDLKREKDAIWAMEEGLKCDSLSAVVGEMQELDFTSSRRLQLAVEQSMVTGFVLRINPRQVNTTACFSRWRVTMLPSQRIDDVPGLGFPAWRVELLRIRNGKPGVWNIQSRNGGFRPVQEKSIRSESSNFAIELHQQAG